jgi:hypothetical protein
MTPLLLLLAAGTAAQPAPRLQATASAVIVAGERISFEARRGDSEISPGRQRRRVVRQGADGRRSEFRLVEFQ